MTTQREEGLTTAYQDAPRARKTRGRPPRDRERAPRADRRERPRPTAWVVGAWVVMGALWLAQYVLRRREVRALEQANALMALVSTVRRAPAATPAPTPTPTPADPATPGAA